MPQGSDAQSIQVVLVTPYGSNDPARLLKPDEYSKYLTPCKTILNSLNSNSNRDKLYFTEVNSIFNNSIDSKNRVSIPLNGNISKLDITEVYELNTVHIELNGISVAKSKIINGRNIINFKNLDKESKYLTIHREITTGNKHSRFINFNKLDDITLSGPKKYKRKRGNILYELSDFPGKTYNFFVSNNRPVDLPIKSCVDIIEISLKERFDDIPAIIRLNRYDIWTGVIHANTQKLILKLKKSDSDSTETDNNISILKNETLDVTDVLYDFEFYDKPKSLSHVLHILYPFEIVFDSDIPNGDLVSDIKARNYNIAKSFEYPGIDQKIIFTP